jgi:hypothetical protein
MSTPSHLGHTPFTLFVQRDILTGATIATGRAYQYNDRDVNMNEANSYTFVPPITIKPGTMILFKE